MLSAHQPLCSFCGVYDKQRQDKSANVARRTASSYAGLDIFLESTSEDEAISPNLMLHTPEMIVSQIGRSTAEFALYPAILHYHIPRGHMILIMTANHKSTGMHGLFTKCADINVEWLRADMPSTTRTDICARFNNPDGSIQVLLGPWQLMHQGVNLRGAHITYSPEPPPSYNIVLQAIGRTGRIGQTRIQHVYMGCDEDIMDEKVHACSTKEFLSQVLSVGEEGDALLSVLMD